MLNTIVKPTIFQNRNLRIKLREALRNDSGGGGKRKKGIIPLF